MQNVIKARGWSRGKEEALYYTDSGKSWGVPTDPAPTVEELELMHRSLTAKEREELLECLLIAASKGADAMMQALLPWLLAAATRVLLKETDGQTGSQ